MLKIRNEIPKAAHVVPVGNSVQGNVFEREKVKAKSSIKFTSSEKLHGSMRGHHWRLVTKERGERP
jgi:hypothetical protein